MRFAGIPPVTEPPSEPAESLPRVSEPPVSPRCASEPPCACSSCSLPPVSPAQPYKEPPLPRVTPAQKREAVHKDRLRRAQDACAGVPGAGTPSESQTRKISVPTGTVLDQCNVNPDRLKRIRKSAKTKGARKAAAMRNHGPQPQRKIVRLAKYDMHQCCGEAGRECKCKRGGINHWSGVTIETTRHYRELLFNPDAKISMYQTRLLLYMVVKPCVDKSVDEWKRTQRYKYTERHNVKVQYFVHDAQTGKEQNLCLDVFSKVLGVSKALITRTRAAVLNNKVPKPDRRFLEYKKGENVSAEYLAVCTFLETLAEDLANESPDTRVIELPAGHKIDFYEVFCKEWERGYLTGEYYRSKFPNRTDPPSKTLFYKVWRNEFNALSVPRRQNRFSKCDTCCALRSNLEAARITHDEEAVKEWKERLYGHYRWVMQHRRKYRHHRKKAADHPET